MGCDSNEIMVARWVSLAEYYVPANLRSFGIYHPGPVRVGKGTHEHKQQTTFICSEHCPTVQ